MRPGWSYDPCQLKDSKQYQLSQIYYTRNQFTAAPATTLEAEKPLSTLIQQAPCYDKQLLARICIYGLSELGCFFSASTFIQCPLLLTLNVLMPTFCFKSCLLYQYLIQYCWYQTEMFPLLYKYGHHIQCRPQQSIISIFLPQGRTNCPHVIPGRCLSHLNTTRDGDFNCIPGALFSSSLESFS